MSGGESDVFVGVVPFVATAQTRSFKRAAQRLGLTPSAVSKAITRLEAELGTRLLNRTSRSVSLTEEGQAFLSSCEEAVSSVRSARARLTEQQRAPRGTLVVSLPLILGRRVILPALQQLLQRHPGLSIQAGLTDRYVRLADENVDVAVRIGVGDGAGLRVRKLGEVRWLTLAAPGYLARHGTPTEPRQLGQHNCLTFRLPHGAPQAWQFAEGTARVRQNLAVQGSLSADDGEALVDAAVQGVGLFQAHHYAVAGALARGELVEVLSAFRAPGPPICLVFAPGKRTAPKVRAFVEFMLERAAEFEPR